MLDKGHMSLIQLLGNILIWDILMDPRIEKALEELKTNGWTFQTADQRLEWWIDEAF
jgi:hypothetical protein